MLYVDDHQRSHSVMLRLIKWSSSEVVSHTMSNSVTYISPVGLDEKDFCKKTWSLEESISTSVAMCNDWRIFEYKYWQKRSPRRPAPERVTLVLTDEVIGIYSQAAKRNQRIPCRIQLLFLPPHLLPSQRQQRLQSHSLPPLTHSTHNVLYKDFRCCSCRVLRYLYV